MDNDLLRRRLIELEKSRDCFAAESSKLKTEIREKDIKIGLLSQYWSNMGNKTPRCKSYLNIIKLHRQTAPYHD